MGRPFNHKFQRLLVAFLTHFLNFLCGCETLSYWKMGSEDCSLFPIECVSLCVISSCLHNVNIFSRSIFFPPLKDFKMVIYRSELGRRFTFLDVQLQDAVLLIYPLVGA